MTKKLNTYENDIGDVFLTYILSKGGDHAEGD